MKYNKQPLDIPAQIAMLKGRGLNIANEQAAEKALNTISYFRLAAYMRPMESDKNTHQYKPGASFENAVALYEFDAELRELVFHAISKIEITLRTKMIHHFSLAHNAFWFLKMSICKNEHLFLENLSSIDREIHRSKEDFIKQHYKKYTKPAYPPCCLPLASKTKGLVTQKTYNIPVTMLCELDLAGRLCGEKRAAVTNYWNTAETERAVRLQLIAAVTTHYYQLVMMQLCRFFTNFVAVNKYNVERKQHERIDRLW